MGGGAKGFGGVAGLISSQGRPVPGPLISRVSAEVPGRTKSSAHFAI